MILMKAIIYLLYFVFYIPKNNHYMDLPLGNFFEVTINSNKLYSYIDEIAKQLKTHEQKLLTLAAHYADLKDTVSEQHKNRQDRYAIQLQKLKKTNQEQVNYMRLFMRDVDKKASDKFHQIENTVQFLSGKMLKEKEAMEEDFAIKLSYIDKKLDNLSGVVEQQEKTSQQIMTLREGLTGANDKISKIALTIQQDSKKRTELGQFLIDKIGQTQRQLRAQNEQICSMKYDMTEQGPKSARKRNKSRQNKQNRKSQCLLNIINRIEQVQNIPESSISSEINLNLEPKGHHPRRSIVANNKLTKTNTSIIHPKSNFANKNNGIKLKEFEAIVLQKLNKIEHINSEKLSFFQKQITKITNKTEIADQHIGILSRKLEKEKFKIVQVSENFKRFDDKKIDEKVIENLKLAIKKQSKDTEEMLELKLSKEIYQKERQKICEKLQFLNELLIDKAQKSQVKKGLAFFEEKIKQIIIVLTEQRGAGQDGALKRTPYKCLSCDKDLQTEKIQAQSKHTPKQNPANVMRCTTNQIRKRIRILNSSTTINNLNED